MRHFLFTLLILPICLNAQIISTVAGTGSAGFSGDSGPALDAQFQRPNAIAFDGAGNLYVSDGNNYRIRKISTTGIITTVAGNGISGFSGDGNPATDAQIMPLSIAADNAGNIYIGESSRIRIVNPAGIISTFAGTGVLGYNGDGIPATDAQLSEPYLGFTDATGAVYFSDRYNHRIRRVDAAGIITTIAGTGISGSSGDDGPATDATLNDPYFLSQNSAGEMFVPDIGARRIRKINATGTITAFAGYGAGARSTGDGGPATAATVAAVNSLAADDSGNVYLCSTHVNTVRKVNASGVISTVVGTGNAGYSGDGGLPLMAELNNPNHVAVYNGNLFIADRNNNCIRKICPGTSSVADARIGNSIQLYPNPSGNKLNIKANISIEEVELINLAGNKVLSCNSHPHTLSKETTIDLRTLPAGLYVVSVNGSFAGRFLKE